MHTVTLQSRTRGVLLGTAVGDALGLPAEGLSRRRRACLFPGPWRHRLVFGHGMLSDDTEQTLFVTQALLAHPDSPGRFARRLAWSLRGWLLGLPAGIGFGTLRAILKLWLGFPPARSGVRSAGNGPTMRVAPIGARFWNDPEKLTACVAASTRVTHSDPRAQVGALAVARLVAWCFQTQATQRPQADELLQLLRGCGAEDPEWQEIIDRLATAIGDDLSVHDYADRLGFQKGISGYTYSTVPVAVYAWYRHCGAFEATLTAVLDCGGDTDTVGAITGALAGAMVGEEGIPREWIAGISDWPRGTGLLYALSDRLSGASRAQRPGQVVRYFWPALLVRNPLFLAIVLVHGFRRLLPPYR
jgi:ADP-ribosylglycohydrolase